MKKTYLSLILLVLIGLLISCEDTNANPNPDPSDGLTRASARNLKQLILDGDEYLVAMFASPSEFKTLSTTQLRIPAPIAAMLNAANVLPQAIDCFSDNTPSVDNDNDGAPVNGFYIIDCTLTNDQNGSSLSLSGSSRVQDKDDNDPRSGYKVDTDEFELRAVNRQGQTSYLKLDLDVDITKQTSNYSVVYNFNLGAKDISGPETGITYTYIVTYTPDNSNAPFAGGTFVYNGSKNFRGEASRYTLNAVANNLHYSGTCAVGFDGGSQTYTDSKGNVLSFVYNGCADVSVSFNNISL